MKKIIGWFKNIVIRILEVIDYMINKDAELELAKLKVKREIAKDIYKALIHILSNRNVQFVLGCTMLAFSFSSLYASSCNFDTLPN